MTEARRGGGSTRDIAGARILARAREIAFPRYPGTPGNDRARAIVERSLREAGLEVCLEPFSYDIATAMRAIRAVLLGSALLVLAAGALAGLSDGWALGLLGAGAALGGAIVVWAPGAERLYEREGPTRTANVVGRRRAERPRLTLVIMAHYDSKSQSLSFPFRMGFTLLAIGGGLALALALAARLAGAGLATWAAAVPAGLSGLSLLALSTMRSGNESPGGVDNAGSVGIVLELARVLPAEIAPDVELVFLCTSAEEDHMIGAMRFLDARRAEWAGRHVQALNFDGAGSPGQAVILDSYGLFHRFAPQISRVALEAARAAGVRLRRVWMPPAMGIDAIPFHHRGVACLTFSSGALGRATVAVHSAGDVADNLHAATLERVARLAAETARRLAGAPRPGAR